VVPSSGNYLKLKFKTDRKIVWYQFAFHSCLGGKITNTIVIREMVKHITHEKLKKLVGK
jgi:hypothetical protein